MSATAARPVLAVLAAVGPVRSVVTLVLCCAAIHALPHVLVFDNGDLTTPFRRAAVLEGSRLVACLSGSPPGWLQALLPS